jgi:hypothetical protein
MLYLEVFVEIVGIPPVQVHGEWLGHISHLTHVHGSLKIPTIHSAFRTELEFLNNLWGLGTEKE